MKQDSPKFGQKDAGLGKKNIFGTAMTEVRKRDSGEKGAGNTGSVPPFQALFVQHFYSLI